MRQYTALIFPLFLIAFALIYLSGKAQPQALEQHTAPAVSQVITPDSPTKLTLKAGDRPLLSLTSNAPASVYVVEERDYLRGVFRPVYEFKNVTYVETALPALYDVSYVVIANIPVAYSIAMGKVDDAAAVLRKGGEVLRAKIKAVVNSTAERPYVVKIPLFSPGTRLELNATPGLKVAVLWSSDYRKLTRGTPLEELCKPESCIDGGSLVKTSEEFDDAYIVAVGQGVLEYRLVATPELLLKVGTCG
ncbi:MAG: hypothetical protein ACK4SY_06365 [Pyrobaculum sp.]